MNSQISIKEFQVIECDNVAGFEEKLNAAMKAGKMLHGQPFIYQDKICQTVAVIEHNNIAPIGLRAG